MDNERLLLWIGFVLAALGGFAGFFEKFLPEHTSKRYSKIWAIGSFLAIFLGAILSLSTSLDSVKEKKESKTNEEKEKKKSDSLQNELYKISRMQLDTAVSIISLSRKLENAQSKLNNTQRSMIDLQKFSYEQLSGGDNKPILIFGVSYTSSFQVPEGHRDRLKIMPYFSIHNTGKTFIKNLEVCISDVYKNVEKVDMEGFGGYTVFNGKQQTNHTYMLNLDLKFDKSKYECKAVDIVATNAQNDIYTALLPINASILMYRADVKWNNGNYTVKILGRYYKDNVFYKSYNYFVNDKQILDEVSYFKGFDIKNLKGIKFCGSVAFQNIQYEIYWHKKTHYVYV